MSLRLALFDMDGVIFQGKNFWLDLHRELGTLEEGERHTRSYLGSDYARLVAEVVGRMWKGKPADAYHRLVAARQYEPGVRQTFRRLPPGLATGLVTSGPRDLAERARRDLGLDIIFSNELVIRDGRISGEFHAAVSDNKAEIASELIAELGIDFSQVLFVAEGENDVDLARLVGVPVAYDASTPAILELARYVLARGELPRLVEIVHRQMR